MSASAAELERTKKELEAVRRSIRELRDEHAALQAERDALARKLNAKPAEEMITKREFDTHTAGLRRKYEWKLEEANAAHAQALADVERDIIARIQSSPEAIAALLDGSPVTVAALDLLLARAPGRNGESKHA